MVILIPVVLSISLASVPGSLPFACTNDLWTTRDKKSGRKPGIFYHMSDVEDRETIVHGRSMLLAHALAQLARYTLVYI